MELLEFLKVPRSSLLQNVLLCLTFLSVTWPESHIQIEKLCTVGDLKGQLERVLLAAMCTVIRYRSPTVTQLFSILGQSILMDRLVPIHLSMIDE